MCQICVDLDWLEMGHDKLTSLKFFCSQAIVGLDVPIFVGLHTLHLPLEDPSTKSSTHWCFYFLTSFLLCPWLQNQFSIFINKRQLIWVFFMFASSTFLIQDTWKTLCILLTFGSSNTYATSQIPFEIL